MTDSNILQDSDIDVNALGEMAEQSAEWLKNAQASEAQEQQRLETQQAENEQALAAQEDPRNQEDWGIGGVVKELQSAFVGGVQDTASSIATLPERGLDIITGEMQEEMKTEEGYDAEWDNWFVSKANPIETKTWWGGLIRSATHFGTMGLAIVKAAPVAAAGATAVGLGRAATAIGGAMTNQWLRAAAVGAASDMASKYSQDANGLQILRDRYGFIDTPLTTNDMDHPVVKTFKNVAEGIGIGEVANGLFRVMGKGMKRVLPNGQVVDAVEDGIAKGDARTASVNEQTLEAAQLELFESGTDFRGHKNKPVANPEQGAPTSRENPVDVRNAQRRMRKELGAEEGSPGSVTTPVQLEVAARTSGLSDEVITSVFRDLVSEPRFQAEMAAVQAGRTTLKEVWGDAIEQFQRIGLGREAADSSPEQYLAEFFEDVKVFHKGKPNEMVVWSAKNIAAADLVIGSLMREIRDLGLVGRELQDITDLGSIDGPGKALFDKLLTTTTEVKRTKLTQSKEFRALEARATDPPDVRAADETLQKEWLQNSLKEEVDNSIDAYRLMLKIAGESENDDLFKAIFETVSMSKDIHNITDFDNWIRTKLRGGELNGKGIKNSNLLIKEWEKVMVNSILSGPKTSFRALLGTSTATFMRPLSTATGAFFNGDGATVRASLASVNAMREAIPEAWKLFKARLNSYWAGDIATIKSRYAEYTKGDENWELFGAWIEDSGRATDGDKAAYYMANMARGLNDNKFLTYSTKVMASIDDTFGYLLSRAKARETAYREALDLFNQGKFTEITPQVLREGEDRFLGQILDADGNIRLDTQLGKNVEFARKEVTLTQDLNGFSKGLNDVFNATPWAKPFFLFARTGVNGLTLTAKHTPVFNFLVKEYNDIARATLDDLSSVQKYGINNAQDLINAKALQKGRLIIGGSIISMAGMHFMNGGLTGNGPTDRQKRQVWLDAGYVPRSINIGGVWVGYDSFEPFNQILAAVADIGDHSELMGEEWTKDNFQKLSLVLMQAASSKSYLQGMQQFVDLLSGEPGQHEKIIASLMNNTMPLAGLRNDIGKLFTPHMKELNKGWADTFRNRNLMMEPLAGKGALPIKYDMLNGKPIRDYDFPTRMWNMFIPIPLNLDQGPGRKLLFDSGYDLRTSTYYGPDGTDLTESPRLRSEFQRYIGMQNLELKLNKLAKDPRVIASIKQMNYDLNNGLRELDPMKSYLHNKLIRRMFQKAKMKAWAQMKQNSEVIRLIEEDKQLKARQKRRLRETSALQLQNK
jgi:hypothetical protein